MDRLRFLGTLLGLPVVATSQTKLLDQERSCRLVVDDEDHMVLVCQPGKDTTEIEAPKGQWEDITGSGVPQAPANGQCPVCGRQAPAFGDSIYTIKLVECGRCHVAFYQRRETGISMEAR